MINNSDLRFKRALLLTFSSVLLITGSTLLWQQVKPPTNDTAAATDLNTIVVTQSKVQANEIKAAFHQDSLVRLGFQQNGKDVFSLLLATYKDHNKQLHNALVFPKILQESILLPSPIGQRQSVWEKTAKTLTEKAPKDVLFLSWWDDGQRINFLSGKDAWLSKPALTTFNSPLWKNLQPNLVLASSQERESLSKMARWLTMDSGQALKEIGEFFGKSRPIYLLVNNDLLMRLAEFVDYGGTPLAVNSIMVPVSDNLHNDISRIKRLVQEEGDGNYLVQKEGLSYHIWYTPKLLGTEKKFVIGAVIAVYRLHKATSRQPGAGLSKFVGQLPIDLQT